MMKNILIYLTMFYIISPESPRQEQCSPERPEAHAGAGGPGRAQLQDEGHSHRSQEEQQN